MRKAQIFSKKLSELKEDARYRGMSDAKNNIDLNHIGSRLTIIEVLLLIVLSSIGWIITNNIILGYSSLALMVIAFILAYTTLVKALRNYIRGKI